MTVSIYYNPRCSKCRQALALLQERGIEPDVIDYLHAPPSEAELENILKLLGMEPDDLMRKGEEEYKKYFKGRDLTREMTVHLMTVYPKVIERPIVIKNDKAVIGRPPESVLEIL